MYSPIVHRISFWESRTSVFQHMVVCGLCRFGRDGRSWEWFRRPKCVSIKIVAAHAAPIVLVHLIVPFHNIAEHEDGFWRDNFFAVMKEPWFLCC